MDFNSTTAEGLCSSRVFALLVAAGAEAVTRRDWDNGSDSRAGQAGGTNRVMDARAHTIDFYFIFGTRRYSLPCIVWRAGWIYKMGKLGILLILGEIKSEKVLIQAHLVGMWLLRQCKTQ